MATELPPPRLCKDTEPTLRGALGEAWELDAGGISKRYPGSAPPELTVASWIARAPYHPFWHSYMIGCVNLRAIPGFEPAIIHLPGATHEVMVYAMDPDHEATIDDRPHLLTPGNFHGQFIEPSDEAAAARIRATVQDVIDGRLNPDTDYMQHWIHRFSASNVKGDPKTAGETRLVIQPADGSPAVELVIPPKPGPQDLH